MISNVDEYICCLNVLGELAQEEGAVTAITVTIDRVLEHLPVKDFDPYDFEECFNVWVKSRRKADSTSVPQVFTAWVTENFEDANNIASGTGFVLTEQAGNCFLLHTKR